MKRTAQLEINREVESAIEEYNTYNRECGMNEWKRLRSCTAEVHESPRYYTLRSYNTIVAFIDKESDTLYDILRYMYGYTATSSQHISKFDKDYGGGKWGCITKLVWRDI